MSVKDILVAAFEKDASSFEAAFSSVMKEKVSAAVSTKFFAVEEHELDEANHEDDEDEYDDEDEDEDDLDEKKLSDKDVKRALASAKAKAKPKETVSLKKPPFKMEEAVLDEISVDLANRASHLLGDRANAKANKKDMAGYEKDMATRKVAVDKILGGAKVMAKNRRVEETNSNEASE